MNGKKATVADVYEAIGEMRSDVKNIHTTCTEIKTRLNNGDIKFGTQQKQIQKNSMQIKFIYAIASFISAGIGYMIFKLFKIGKGG